MKNFLIVLSCISLIGCAAAGVPVTFNPDKKLWYAESLIYDLGRPLPAETLIEEAVRIYEKRKDEVGLARAYRTYANFLEYQAVAVDNDKERYRNYRRVSMDKTVTFDNLHEKALEYWRKALYLFEKNSMYDGASNAYINIGILLGSSAFHDSVGACENFEKGLQSHLRFRESNPNTRVDLPKGFNSFEEYVLQGKKEMGCSWLAEALLAVPG